MSEAAPAPERLPMHYDLYFMILAATGDRVLLLPGAPGWTLPHATDAEVEPWDPAALVALVRRQWGAPVTYLRIGQGYLDREVTRQATFFYALESADPTWTPPDSSRWVDQAQLAALSITPTEAREAIATWLAEETSGLIPVERPPWARRGWFALASAWIAETLAARDQALTGPVTQFKTWSISCLLRAETTVGTVYMKAAPVLPLFTDEPVLTAALARAYPGWVPEPLAVEPEERWMLLADFGGPLLQDADASVWDTVIAHLATVQQSSIPNVNALLAAGCLDRRLAQLAVQIEPLVAATAIHARLSAEEKAALAAAAPRLHALCAELAAFGIPETLVHGDLHANNIAVRDGVPLFFDWSDACIAHPFLDLATLLDPEWMEKSAEQEMSLLDRYLSAWTDYAPLPRLQEAAQVAAVLGGLHQAISYQHIVLSAEPAARWELEGGWSWAVRKILAALAALPA